MTPDIRLVALTKRFEDVVAVDGISFEIDRGSFFAMLGPSGCGKTTTLRMIGGFEEPTSGVLELGGTDVSRLPPYRRDVNTVFQSYALFPHLTVFENVAFGLRRRKVRGNELRRRVGEALELVGLAGLDRRKPRQLSGGQQQRIALARALVNHPRVLLLDEPLGALDLKLRKEMQLELKELNRRLGITFVLVTHDQHEALAMSDRIAVMSAGSVEQCGEPGAIYDRPRTAFVARFIGEANVLSGDVAAAAGGVATIAGLAGTWRVPMPDDVAAGARVRVAVRPERHRLVPADAADDGSNSLEVAVRDVVFLGESIQVIVELADGTVARATLRNDGAPRHAWARGDSARLRWRCDDGHVLR